MTEDGSSGSCDCCKEPCGSRLEKRLDHLICIPGGFFLLFFFVNWKIRLSGNKSTVCCQKVYLKHCPDFPTASDLAFAIHKMGCNL